MSKTVELPNNTSFEDLSFWKCPRCNRIFVSLKTEQESELYCAFCSSDFYNGALRVQPVCLPGKK